MTSDKKPTKLRRDSSTCKVHDQLDDLADGRSLRRGSMVAVSYRKHVWNVECTIDGEPRKLLIQGDKIFDLTEAK